VSLGNDITYKLMQRDKGWQLLRELYRGEPTEDACVVGPKGGQWCGPLFTARDFYADAVRTGETKVRGLGALDPCVHYEGDMRTRCESFYRDLNREMRAHRVSEGLQTALFSVYALAALGALGAISYGMWKNR
jgi:hypothetical protein